MCHVVIMIICKKDSFFLFSLALTKMGQTQFKTTKTKMTQILKPNRKRKDNKNINTSMHFSSKVNIIVKYWLKLSYYPTDLIHLISLFAFQFCGIPYSCGHPTYGINNNNKSNNNHIVSLPFYEHYSQLCTEPVLITQIHNISNMCTLLLSINGKVYMNRDTTYHFNNNNNNSTVLPENDFYELTCDPNYNSKTESESYANLRSNNTYTKLSSGIGGTHVIMLDTNGELWSIGWNDQGQRGIFIRKPDKMWDKPIKLPLSRFDFLNLDLDKQIRILDMSCGDQFTVILTECGLCFTCGLNCDRQLGLSETRFKESKPTLVDWFVNNNISITAISAAHDFWACIGNNHLWCVRGIPQKLDKYSNIDSIICGYSVVLILTKSGQVLQIYWNGRIFSILRAFEIPNNINNINKMNRITEIMSGNEHFGVMTAYNEYYLWGCNRL